MNVRMPIDRERRIRLAPHRFGQVGNMIIFEKLDGERILDLYLSDAELRQLASFARRRLERT